ncbi:NAD(P)-dependent dehydrogenase (Short-subunit alcohol dehydrogenase family) [Aeromicrobium sp. 9AM]|nr:NAD(P)-dependent dehydrogenase (Short-subunit alcohol dehydrogenase family) [Aeromicrobium sp. 9AM]
MRSMDMDLMNKTVVVTGGSRGIGYAVAKALSDEGARIVVGARDMTDELKELCESSDVSFVPVDLATPTGPAALVDAAVDRFGAIDVLVNNVGASEPSSSALTFTDEQWQRIFDITFFSAVRAVRAAVPAMRGNSGASVITISSLNARLPAPIIAPYSAAKAALTNFGTALSEELAPQGIRVNTISPGPVRTPLWMAPGGFAHVMTEGTDTTPAEFMDRVLPESMNVATGRVSEAHEIADLVLFLASSRSANITGADYVIDGGMLKSAS